VTVSPTTGTTATAFAFTVTPPTTGAGIRNIKVDFGDGSEVALGPVTSATAVSHQYSSAGTYTVTVTLTDGGGADTFGVVVVTVS
jgi:PKD repeat protein